MCCIFGCVAPESNGLSDGKVAYVATVDISLRYLLLNQMRAVAEAGYDVTGVSAPGPDIPAVERAGIRHLPVPMTRAFTPLHDLKSLWLLFAVMRRERFSIVHTHTPKAGLLGQIAARLAGVPVVFNTVFGFYFHDHMSPFRRRFYIVMETIAARFSDVILSQNSEDIETAVRERICSRDKIQYLGNGIDLERFAPARFPEAGIARTRAEVGIPPGAPVVGFVGRLVEEKGLLELFTAARIVRDAVPAVRFLIVGPVDPDKADALPPDAAQQHGVADICHCVGMRQDTPEMYALMDVFTLPSHREGFPRAPMEASAMGVPVVVTDIRGCRETVLPGINGVLVPVRDAGALARALIDLLTDRAMAQRMGEEGTRLARERFDERLVFQKVLGEYARLLGQKHRAASDGSRSPVNPR